MLGFVWDTAVEAGQWDLFDCYEFNQFQTLQRRLGVMLSERDFIHLLISMLSDCRGEPWVTATHLDASDRIQEEKG
jgi:hypothetical protein